MDDIESTAYPLDLRTELEPGSQPGRTPGEEPPEEPTEGIPAVMPDRARRTPKTPNAMTHSTASGDDAPEPPTAVIPEQSAVVAEPAPRFGDANVLEMTLSRATGRRREDALLATATARLPAYQRIADHLRARIESGELPPGSDLPSEAQLRKQYGASDKTVRSAVAKLRSEGLVTSHQGSRTKVRPRPQFVTSDILAFDPTISRTGKRFRSWDNHGWTAVHEPGQYRTSAGHYHTALRVPPAADVLITRRQLLHTSGVQVIHSLFIPLAVAADNALAHPFRPPTDLYATLIDAGHELHWRDTTAAAMPSPDDTVTLGIPEGLPLLIHIRITLDHDNQPLALEETRLPSHRAIIAHTQTS